MSLFAIADLHLSLGADKPMDIFPGWAGYVEKLEKNWRENVRPEDTVVIAGDISWGLEIGETKEDFAFLDSLPGTKLLLKGNHDLWFSTKTKVERFFEENGFSRLKRGNRLFFMAVIRRGDHDGINFLDFQQIGVIVKHLCFRELFMESIACGGFRIGSGNDFPTLFRLVHLPTVSAPSANGD